MGTMAWARTPNLPWPPALIWPIDWPLFVGCPWPGLVIGQGQSSVNVGCTTIRGTGILALLTALAGQGSVEAASTQSACGWALSTNTPEPVEPSEKLTVTF